MKAIRYAAIYLLLFTVAACASKPYAIQAKADLPANGPHKIYIVSHGWHTGLVLPASTLQSRLPELKQRFGEVSYLELGWGDKGFYQANEITVGLALRAMFWSSGSVLHVVAVPENVSGYFSESEVKPLCLGDDNLATLLDFIEGSFARDAQGHLITLQNGLYGNSQFYEGIGTYHMLNTCNKWTAKALQSAGMDISPALRLTAGSVMSALQAVQDRCQ